MIRAPRLSKKVQKHIFDSFVSDLTAKQTHELSRKMWKKGGCSRIAVNRYFRHYREKIRESAQQQYPKLSGEVEIDIGFFGGSGSKWTVSEVKTLLDMPVREILKRKKKIKQKARKRPVLGLLQRGGTLVLIPLEGRGAILLRLLIMQVIVRGSVIYSDKEKGLSHIKLDGYIHRVVDKKAKKRDGYHTNNIESFWGRVRGAMNRKYKGVPRSTLDLHIKEREFRYNHRRDLEDALRSLLK
jgi:transposase